ncbi:MAG: phosphoribosylamine--glycine ligase [Candidatus Latescibacteria bacterium]|nr:phosphoribosylamine--glycine ligase [Candidatus Latescibacterota bacterium]NIM21645.1 phosphoribosylamine--glycine ligase [Candidatus Latescibacterota bacterium]NIM64624.1 phosphoribosylamine--glycine ligase [Candidatus Latescibacterota bacterium]NIO01139.1 phosphoribosylamine--glycine ligase [Candidatus Latescibacterota bacterium]NIO27532.1 phosphoribosylamine--glycine ligase [Candidatus Latescibacterota bacterium]
MKVLIVGGGGREHALGWAVSKSPELSALYTAPGNGGTAVLGENPPIDPADIESLVGFAKENSVDLTIVGPEAPLVAGIVDRFTGEGLRCFGPSALAARLEGSKVFAKQFMRRHGIPTADFEIFDDPDAAERFLDKKAPPLVVKADGLAAGKGVIVAQSREEASNAIHGIMREKKFGASGDRIVIESCLEGEEASIHAICSGEKALMLPPSQDHKRIHDGDRGPNTGGMGAYAPVPRLKDAEVSLILETVVKPTLQGMEMEGTPFKGLLYAGLMLTSEGPKVLEFNVRFGDPETQAVVPLIADDLLNVLYNASSDELQEGIAIHGDRAAATVVVASAGYPGSYEKGFVIEGLAAVDDEDRVVFHAGTAEKEGRLVTSGGRVFAVTAWAPGLEQALARAYDGIEKTRFEGAYWRKDIGYRAVQGTI